MHVYTQSVNNVTYTSMVYTHAIEISLQILTLQMHELASPCQCHDRPYLDPRTVDLMAVRVHAGMEGRRRE